MSLSGLRIIGERINPGFRSTKALFDHDDFAGIEALARRQAEAGASYLNVNAGTKALENPDFLMEVIRRIQAAVDLPLSLDCADTGILARAIETYDPAKAKGQKPIINSIAESRWALHEVLAVRPCKVVLMSSERLVEGRVTPNRTGAEVHESARGMMERLKRLHPTMSNEDFLVDVSIATLAADSEGLIAMALDGIGRVGADPGLKGVHIMGGLSNLSQHLPDKALDGSDLKHKLECAFLTAAMPLGFDTVLGTPWRGYRLLPEDDFVLKQFRHIVAQEGSEALAAVVGLYMEDV